MFRAEWGKVDSFTGSVNGLFIPAPIIALDQGRLLGGLSYTSAKRPDSDVPGLWINAVLVVPGYRGQGIATQLVKKAVDDARHAGFEVLFVYTDKPAFYEKLDFEITDDSHEHVILKTSL